MKKCKTKKYKEYLNKYWKKFASNSFKRLIHVFDIDSTFTISNPQLYCLCNSFPRNFSYSLNADMLCKLFLHEWMKVGYVSYVMEDVMTPRPCKNLLKSLISQTYISTRMMVSLYFFANEKEILLSLKFSSVSWAFSLKLWLT